MPRKKKSPMPFTAQEICFVEIVTLFRLYAHHSEQCDFLPVPLPYGGG
jgi:hypothetical protein